MPGAGQTSKSNLCTLLSANNNIGLGAAQHDTALFYARAPLAPGFVVFRTALAFVEVLQQQTQATCGCCFQAKLPSLLCWSPRTNTAQTQSPILIITTWRPTFVSNLLSFAAEQKLRGPPLPRLFQIHTRTPPRWQSHVPRAPVHGHCEIYRCHCAVS